MISLIDVGFGNISSLILWLSNAGLKYEIVQEKRDFKSNDIILMPGVGSAEFAINQLKVSGLFEKISKHIRSGGTYVGICVGMQILFDFLEEGSCKGFGVFEGRVVSLGSQSNTGWSNLTFRKNDVPETWHCGFGLKSRYKGRVYNNHTFGVKSTNVKCNEFCTLDETDSFVQIVCNSNVLGFQFHPEKSQDFGEEIAAFLGRLK